MPMDADAEAAAAAAAAAAAEAAEQGDAAAPVAELTNSQLTTQLALALQRVDAQARDLHVLMGELADNKLQLEQVAAKTVLKKSPFDNGFRLEDHLSDYPLTHASIYNSKTTIPSLSSTAPLTPSLFTPASDPVHQALARSPRPDKQAVLRTYQYAHNGFCYLSRTAAQLEHIYYSCAEAAELLDPEARPVEVRPYQALSAIIVMVKEAFEDVSSQCKFLFKPRIDAAILMAGSSSAVIGDFAAESISTRSLNRAGVEQMDDENRKRALEIATALETAALKVAAAEYAKHKFAGRGQPKDRGGIANRGDHDRGRGRGGRGGGRGGAPPTST